MATPSTDAASDHQKRLRIAAECSNDPLLFVKVAFPWGKPGPLVDDEGPDQWQTETLAAIRDGLMSVGTALQFAIASGHDIGKTAFVAWLILWAMTTRPDTRGVVTANTEVQLRTKTWPEVVKWQRLSAWQSWFEVTATAMFSVAPAHDKTWRIDAVAWSERNTEAFAGLHNAGRRILIVFDEASAIPDVIWETTDGATTDADAQILWFVAGNPTRSTGRFRQCFAGGRFAHRWINRQIDSRNSRRPNKQKIADWITDYGEDSDFVRVRVRGVFPRAGNMQFIGSDIVDEARQRPALADVYDPFVIGVDVARFGSAKSVICFRKGRDARSHAPIKLRGVSTMTLAGRVAEEWARFQADAVFVDGGGVGGGVVDRLRQLRVPVIEVQFGGKADRLGEGDGRDSAKYANKRAEMWGLCRDWLKGGAIVDDPELIADLTGVEYGYNSRDEIQLERKEHMEERGLASPDDGDALALTFAYPVQPNARAGYEGAFRRGPAVAAGAEYSPFENI